MRSLGPRFLGGVALALLACFSACDNHSTSPTTPPLVQGPAGSGESATATIGLGGGTVTLGSTAVLDVPAAAVDGPTAITLTATRDLPPAALENATPIVTFTPHGTRFAVPATVLLSAPGNPDELELYWTNSDGDFEAADSWSLGSDGDGAVVATIDHFSQGTLKARPRFAGPPVMPSGPAPRPSRAGSPRAVPRPSPTAANVVATLDRSRAVADGRDSVRLVFRLVDDRGRGVGGQRIVVSAGGSQNHITQPRVTQMATGTTFAMVSSTVAEKKELRLHVLGLDLPIGTVDFTVPTGAGAAGDPDQCALGTHDCSPSATCTNTSDGYSCACNPGFSGDGKSCTDLDECAAGNNGGCDPHARCYNRVGTVLCVCDDRYIGDGKSCTHVDDCATANGGCEVHATCSRTPTGHTCACNSGWSGDGVTCADVDECATNNGGCSANATCTNAAGNRVCLCKPGWSGDGVTCVDVNECAVDNGGCDANAICTNATGTSSCACTSGYSGDGRQPVRNGSFESGRFDGWTAAGDLTNVQDPVAAGDATANPFSGRYVARVRNSGNTGAGAGSILQTFATIDVARSYSVSVDLGVRDLASAAYEVQLVAGATVVKRASGSITGSVAGELSKRATVTLIAAPADLAGLGGQLLGVKILNSSGAVYLIVDNVRAHGGCVDVDECATNNGGCGLHATCANSTGGFTCTCTTGYTGAGCAACAAGYQDNDANSTCLPTCATSGLACGSHGSCTDASGSATCACATGYTGAACSACAAGYQDKDLNGTCLPTCATSGLACGAHGTCTDASGSAACACATGYTGATCAVCATGYQDNDANGTCLPTCATSGLACGLHGTCTDAAGSAVCSCAVGYTGATCAVCATGYQDRDANGTCLPTCATAGNCGGNGTCSDASGSAICTCNSGYQPSGGTCVDLDECATGGACDANAACANSTGSFSCSCAGGTGPGTGANLAVDAGFERGSFGAWSSVGAGNAVLDPVAAGLAATNPFAGRYLAQLRGGPGYVEQAIGSIDPTRTYSVQVDVGAFGSGVPGYEVQLRAGATVVRLASGSVAGTVPGALSNVRTVSVTVAPPDLVGRGGQPLSVRISNVSAADFLYADNVRTGGFGCAVPDVDECADSSHTCDANAACTNSAGGYSCACSAGLTGAGSATPVNPSFESGTFAGWSASGSATDVHNPIANGEANNPFAGSYVARLRNASAAPATLEQSLGLVDAARSYTVTVDLGVFGAASASYEVQLSAGATLLMSDSGVVTGSVAGQYTKVKTATVTVGPTELAGHAGQALLVTIVAASNGQTLVVDNVRSTGFGCAPPPPAPKLVFATSATFSGDSLGGLAGADAKCAAAASAAARPGTFLAWLSDGVASPATRFFASASGWALANGTLVAASWSDLVDGSLAAAINVDENGLALAPGRAWTGTQANGASLANPADTSCSFWSGAAQFGGITGLINASDSTWSAVGADACANANRIYCFQQ